MGFWTPKELQTLRTLWPVATPGELHAALPHRSLAAITGRAGQLHLGRRDRKLGRVDAKGDLALNEKIHVGSDPLLMRLRQHHDVDDVQEFAP